VNPERMSIAAAVRRSDKRAHETQAEAIEARLVSQHRRAEARRARGLALASRTPKAS